MAILVYKIGSSATDSDQEGHLADTKGASATNSDQTGSERQGTLNNMISGLAGRNSLNWAL